MVFAILNASGGFLEAFQQTFRLAAMLALAAAALLAVSPRIKQGPPADMPG